MSAQSPARGLVDSLGGLSKAVSGFLGTPVVGAVFSAAIVALSIAFYATNAFGALDIRPRDSLEDYQWGELKLLANMIASAGSDEEGIEIASRFNLCRGDGTIDPEDTKLMEFGDGSGSQEFRIIGFRHDRLAGRDAMAGITFCFCGPVGETPACLVGEGGSADDGGGWPASELRAYAGGFVTVPASYRDKLPLELGRCVARVGKSSWIEGNVAGSDDVLFALSYEELFGSRGDEGSGVLPPTSSEGSQYQFFSQNGGEDLRVFLEDCEGGFWLRSVPPGNDCAFLVAGGDYEDANPLSSDVSASVVLAFCL